MVGTCIDWELSSKPSRLLPLGRSLGFRTRSFRYGSLTSPLMVEFAWHDSPWKFSLGPSIAHHGFILIHHTCIQSCTWHLVSKLQTNPSHRKIEIAHEHHYETSTNSKSYSAHLHRLHPTSPSPVFLTQQPCPHSAH